MVDYNFIIW